MDNDGIPALARGSERAKRLLRLPGGIVVDGCELYALPKEPAAMSVADAAPATPEAEDSIIETEDEDCVICLCSAKQVSAVCHISTIMANMNSRFSCNVGCLVAVSSFLRLQRVCGANRALPSLSR
eukprot:SAG31_NODE_541_length_14275_cov_6.690886_11_plen_126_part_00